ncbi:DNA-3-methyladenine glycosylase [Lacticaseibacillus sp. GG6-2]
METDWQQWAQSAATPALAQALLGAELMVDGCGGLIVETEAYLGASDQAAHAYQNHQTRRNQALWAPPSTIYVYQMRQYCLLNLNVQAQGVPECILIRALEPTRGLVTMTQRRHREGVAIANGPGKLCQALALTLADNGMPLGRGRVALRLNAALPQTIACGPRVGVPNKGEWTTAPLRYWVAHNPYVSGISRRAVDLHQKGWQHATNEHA